MSGSDGENSPQSGDAVLGSNQSTANPQLNDAVLGGNDSPAKSSSNSTEVPSSQTQTSSSEGSSSQFQKSSTKASGTEKRQETGDPPGWTIALAVPFAIPYSLITLPFWIIWLIFSLVNQQKTDDNPPKFISVPLVVFAVPFVIAYFVVFIPIWLLVKLLSFLSNS